MTPPVLKLTKKTGQFCHLYFINAPPSRLRRSVTPTALDPLRLLAASCEVPDVADVRIYKTMLKYGAMAKIENVQTTNYKS